ncbi:MAG: sulfotransferase [Proteobacteria bacterium]|nr:sulfotransferase [Pseudomonadota bacterium]
MNTSDATIGMQLAHMGRFSDALPYLERAHRAVPADLPLLHAVASLLQRIGRTSDAVDRYRSAAALAPKNTEVLIGWARALLLEGHFLRAIELLGRAVTLEPRVAEAGGLLDMLLSEVADADRVCAILNPLVDHHPKNANLVRRYASALVDADRLQEAEEAYKIHCGLLPGDALGHTELGRLAVGRGETGGALEHFRAALEIDPENASALWSKAQAEGARVDQTTLALVHRLTQTEQKTLSVAALHDILARHYDRSGEFRAAAAHTTRVNELQAQVVPPQERYTPQRWTLEIDATIRDYHDALFHRLRGTGSSDRRPVFIIGLPRSGTTLLEQMLAAHPAIIGVGEQQFARESLRRALANSGWKIESLTAPAIGDATRQHLHRLEDRAHRLHGRHAALRIVDKLPDNYMLAGWLSIAFPNAAIIHCLRDPRDVALSCWQTQFRQLHWSFDLDHIVHRIEQHRRVMHHWHTTIGDRLTEIRYERLVVDPETELQRALAAVELDWHADVLTFAERKGFVRSASEFQVREPLHARSVGRWRDYEEVLAPVLPRLDAIVKEDMHESPLRSSNMDNSDATTGMALVQTGRFEEALNYLDSAYRNTPTDLPILHAFAHALQMTGRPEEAVNRFRHCATLMPDNVEVLLGWARAWWKAGEDNEGLVLLERALTLDPRVAEPDGMLDMMLESFEADPELSFNIHESLVTRFPERADLLFRYAHASLATERMETAKGAFERYSLLQPRDPAAHADLARLAVIRGDFEDARQHLDAAFTIDPDYPPAIWEEVQIEGRQLDESALSRIQHLLETERDPSMIPIFHNILARHNDRIGEYSISADHIRHANTARIQCVPADKRYRPEQAEDNINLTIADLTPVAIENLRGTGNPDARPVFIIGMPRSGTTLLSQMLAAHPSIISVGEQMFASKSFCRALIRGRSATIAGIPATVIREAADWHLRKLEERVHRLSLNTDAKRIVDKLPGNYLYAGWIHIAFPNATIIHSLRDPRDVALSCWRTQFTNIAWGLDLEHITHRLEQHRRIMRHWRATLGDRLIDVCHERLVADPQTELRRVLAAMGMDWHPDVLAFSERKGFVRTASQFQVRQPLNSFGIGKWRRYEEALQPFLPRLDAIAAQDAIEMDSTTPS